MLLYDLLFLRYREYPYSVTLPYIFKLQLYLINISDVNDAIEASTQSQLQF